MQTHTLKFGNVRTRQARLSVTPLELDLGSGFQGQNTLQNASLILTDDDLGPPYYTLRMECWITGRWREEIFELDTDSKQKAQRMVSEIVNELLEEYRTEHS